MRENHHVDRGIVETEAIEITAERSWIRSAIYQYPALTVAYVRRIPLPDVENVHDQLAVATLLAVYRKSDGAERADEKKTSSNHLGDDLSEHRANRCCVERHELEGKSHQLIHRRRNPAQIQILQNHGIGREQHVVHWKILTFARIYRRRIDAQ